MAYWLMKSEPDEFSIDDLQAKGKATWDGVRNYQARNFIRQMQLDDEIFFYHSSCKHLGISGLMTVCGEHSPDPLACDPSSPYYDEKSATENRWSAIEVCFKQKYNKLLSLQEIKKLAKDDQRLDELLLIAKGNRLSVMPISPSQWQCLMEKLSGTNDD